MLDEQRIYAEEQERMQGEMQQAQQMKAMSQGPDMMTGAGDTGASATGQPQQPQQAPAGGGGGGGDGGQQQAAPAGPPPSPVDQFLSQRQNAPNVPRTPEDLQAQAQTIANQLLAMPDAQKNAELIKLKRSDQTMHALVTSMIDDIRQQARSQGGQMVMAQQFGQGGGGGAPPQ